MRQLLALPTAALLCLGLCACASTRTNSASQVFQNSVATASTAATSTSSSTPSSDYTKVDGDKDNDVGAPSDDTNNNQVSDFGHAASEPYRRAITALVKRYYAAALADDGAKACSMIYSTLAESVPEDYGGASHQPLPAPYLRGETCAAVLTGLFKHLHAQLTVEVPKLEVARVRVEEHHALVLLRFGKLPERQIPVAREGRIWRMEELLDSELS
ncbi:MAG: hypothetical protein WAU77_14395 [Solirubrobacteraceae bacterium]